jgi:hypothetical protein
LVVSGGGGTGYTGDNRSHNATFIVTGYSDVPGAYWIQYTGSASSTESVTADTGLVVTGYLYRIEAQITQAANTLGLHRLDALPDILMDVHTSLSVELVVRLYRTANANVSGGLNEAMAIIDWDCHFEQDTLGSAEPLTK